MTNDTSKALSDDVTAEAVEVQDFPFKGTDQIMVDTLNVQYPVYIAGQYNGYGKAVIPTQKVLPKDFDTFKLPKVDEKIDRSAPGMPDAPTDLYIPIDKPTLSFVERVKRWFK